MSQHIDAVAKQSDVTALSSYIGNIKNVGQLNISGWDASNVGQVIDSALQTDCNFIGYLSRNGRHYISGYHYMVSGGHYFSAIVLDLSGNLFAYCGLAGQYTKHQFALS